MRTRPLRIEATLSRDASMSLTGKICLIDLREAEATGASSAD
jgi:hypothetical protein